MVEAVVVGVVVVQIVEAVIAELFLELDVFIAPVVPELLISVAIEALFHSHRVDLRASFAFFPEDSVGVGVAGIFQDAAMVRVPYFVGALVVPTVDPIVSR